MGNINGPAIAGQCPQLIDDSVLIDEFKNLKKSGSGRTPEEECSRVCGRIFQPLCGRKYTQIDASMKRPNVFLLNKKAKNLLEFLLNQECAINYNFSIFFLLYK